MMANNFTNLFENIPARLPVELAELLYETAHCRIERIVSRQHATPPGQWYDQVWDEWVLLVSGSAGLRIDGRPDPVTMKSGDAILLPAHVRHRVEWTDPECDTIWLAIHASPSGSP
jgi:cupin 2 domain-containing protein